jgi:OOP family OmpA-OmpF porin
VNAGWGIAAYKPWVSSAHAGGVAISDGDLKKEFDAAKDAGLQYGTNKDKDNIHEQFFPVGLGAKFKLSDKIGLVLGYTMNFLDGDNLDNYQAKYTTKDKWSYGYAGLDFSLGDGSKPNLDWVNPVAVLYDDLKDPSLRQEVEALNGRVSTLENTVNQLSADADGDGVSNKFDKCANTPAGSIVDGAGCPIKFPEPVVQNTTSYPSTYSNIMFEFDSSVLKTSSYPTLDQLSADLKANPSAQLTLNGYASAEGTEAYNLRLSDDRANSVKTYLVNSGVDASRITTKPYGEANPVASNATEEGRIQNRRVEIRK